MAGSDSAYLRAALLAQVFGAVEFTPPDTVYLGLWESDLDQDSDGSAAGEAAYSGYERVEIGTSNNQEDAWDAPNDDGTWYVTNMEDVVFPTCTSGTATVTFGAVLDADEAGNILAWFSVDPLAVSAGSVPTLPAGTLRIELAG